MSKPDTPGKWRDLSLRAGAALVLVPIVILCVYLGGIAYLVLLILAAFQMALEWCKLVFPEERRPVQTMLHLLTVLGVLLGLIWANPLVSLICFGAGWGASTILARGLEANHYPWALLGIPYLILPIASLYVLRADPGYGLMAVIWVLVVIWATDTGAYFAGKTIGGPKLSPRFSPKKTWSGLAGGALLAALAGAGVANYFNIVPFGALALLAAFVAVVSQGGDIFESAMKRNFGVKDSGTILPGHGGILDRVDGLIFAAVLCAGIGVMRAGIERAGAGLLVW
ncbi:MAG: phosphatidate cytidylyltransferase [Hyphomicrobiales bacterium]